MVAAGTLLPRVLGFEKLHSSCSFPHGKNTVKAKLSTETGDSCIVLLAFPTGRAMQGGEIRGDLRLFAVCLIRRASMEWGNPKGWQFGMAHLTSRWGLPVG